MHTVAPTAVDAEQPSTCQGPAVPCSAALILALVQIPQALRMGHDAAARLLLRLRRLLLLPGRSGGLLVGVGAGLDFSAACMCLGLEQLCGGPCTGKRTACLHTSATCGKMRSILAF